MTYFYSISAFSQLQLLGGQRAPPSNPMRFPGTWPVSGLPPPMAAPDITLPGSTSLSETPRLLPLPPVRPPGPSPLSSQLLAPPANFPVTYPPGGPGTPCSSSFSTASILIPHQGQSSFHGFPLVGYCLPFLPSHHCLRVFSVKPMNWGPLVWSLLAGSVAGLQREV